MKIGAKYSHLNGYEWLLHHYPSYWTEIEDAITSVNAASHRTKVSRERTMLGKLLFDPAQLNLIERTKPMRIGCPPEVPLDRIIAYFETNSIERPQKPLGSRIMRTVRLKPIGVVSRRKKQLLQCCNHCRHSRPCAWISFFLLIRRDKALNSGIQSACLNRYTNQRAIRLDLDNNLSEVVGHPLFAAIEQRNCLCGLHLRRENADCYGPVEELDAISDIIQSIRLKQPGLVVRLRY